MIKGVFFDLYQTLIHFDPPREQLLVGVLKNLGVDVAPESLRRALVSADEFIYQEFARQPLSKRSDEEKVAVYMQYQRLLLKEARVEASERLIGATLSKMQQIKLNHVLFDDVLPALARLKERRVILGLVSNVDHDITSMLDGLGLSSLLQVVVTSQEVGLSKPHPEIFQEALRKAKIAAAEALYVGDQYQVDVIGARNAGMRGVLLDRHDDFKEITDCPRIRGLEEILNLLKTL
jgi:putative hydrolase of the HAD superfamily